MEIVKETTFWECDYVVPNHTYLIDNKGRVIAYAIEHGNQVMRLKSGFVLNKRYRKFVQTNHRELSKIANEYINKNPEKQIKKKKDDNVRLFKVKSDTKEYEVEYNISGKFFNCTCVGFGFRRKCKHVESVKEFLK
jgi:hypothetical protein